MSEFPTEYELQAVIVEHLREDAELHALLFPADRPSTQTEDVRIYESDVELPIALRTTLPRVLVAVSMDTSNWEQDDLLGDLGPAQVYIHHFSERDESERVQKMAEATTKSLRAFAGGATGSTGAVSTRIMLSPLVKAGQRVKDRQPAFDEARRITDTYITRLVGVLV